MYPRGSMFMVNKRESRTDPCCSRQTGGTQEEQASPSIAEKDLLPSHNTDSQIFFEGG